MSNVKGAAVTARLRFVRERHGEAGLRHLLGTMAAGDRAVLQGNVQPQAWVPFDVFVALCVGVDAQFGGGDLALCETMGRYAAEVNLPTVYRIFYRLGSPTFILRKAAQLWSEHYTAGKLAAIEEGKGAVRLEIVDFDQPHRAHCLGVMGWAARSVELSGGTVTSLAEERCRTRGDETCEIALRWT